MHAAYKILYLVPSVLHESRYAIGAVVRSAGKTTFVPALRMPSAEMLGGESEQRLLQAVIERAGFLRTLEEREAMRLLGQHIALGPDRDLFRSDCDPIEWLQTCILPHG